MQQLDSNHIPAQAPAPTYTDKNWKRVQLAILQYVTPSLIGMFDNKHTCWEVIERQLIDLPKQ